MSQDYNYEPAKSVDKVTGYPKDRWGHLLDKYDERDTLFRELTSPYGSLHFAVGDGEDFYCFDFATITGPNGHNFIILHSTINSETACFIEGGSYEVITPVQDETLAADVALGMTDDALEWVSEPFYSCHNRMKYGKHTKRGWNQDPWYFYRSVFIAEQQLLGRDTPTFSERQRRIGGKRINTYTKLTHIIT